MERRAGKSVKRKQYGNVGLARSEVRRVIDVTQPAQEANPMAPEIHQRVGKRMWLDQRTRAKGVAGRRPAMPISQ